MKIQYLAYLVIIAALVTGYVSVHPIILVVFALLSTLILMTARRKQVKSEVQSVPKNLVLDGAYLFVGQAMLMFIAYILGWFLANNPEPSGMLAKSIYAFIACIVIGAIFAGISIVIRRKR